MQESTLIALLLPFSFLSPIAVPSSAVALPSLKGEHIGAVNG